jgi:phage tail sheath protein FI
MPEYLAPGVYVEEVELAPRAITAVSTSTTGFVGLTRRGPVNKPTLVTSFGQYLRFFGGYLPEPVYRGRRYLPYAVEGFFANGGSRAYVVRVAPLPQTDEQRGDPANFAQVASALLANQQTARRSLGARAEAEATSLQLAYSGGLAVDSALVVGDGANAETVRVTGFTDVVQITPALAFDHAEGEGVTEVEVQDANTTLAAQPPNTEGATTLRVQDRGPLTGERWVRLRSATRTFEYVQLGTFQDDTAGPGEVPIQQPLAGARTAGTTVEPAAAPGGASTTLDGEVGEGDTLITASSAGLAAGDLVIIAGTDAAHAEVVALAAPPSGSTALQFGVPALRFGHPDGANLVRLTFPAAAATTQLVPGLHFSAAVEAGPGDQLLIGPEDELETVTLASAPEDNEVTIARDLRFAHAAGTTVRTQRVPASTTALTADADQGAAELAVNDVGELRAGDVIEIHDGAQTEYVEIASIQDTTVRLNRGLRYPHAAAQSRIRRLAGALRVLAGPADPDPAFYPEPGAWGNEIRIRTQAMSTLTTRATAPAMAGAAFLEVEATTGIEAGTVLRFPGNEFRTVTRVEGRRVFVAGGVPEAGLDSTATGATAWRAQVSSQEFRLTVSWNGTDEVYDGLSMASGHSRYVLDVVNGSSMLVHLELAAGGAAAPDNLPLAGDRYPGGGSDGLAGVGVATYRGADHDDADRRSGIFALFNEPGISIATVPGIAEQEVQSALISHCERARYRFAVLDAAAGASLDDVQRQRARLDSQYAALYYPWLKVFDPLANDLRFVPPSGHIAGLYARTDQEVGVHKAPANAVLRDVSDLQFTVGKGQQDVLNPKGINAIRAFPNRGIRVWGARTISSDSPWRYVNVRRLMIMIEASIDEGTQYAVFEPNDVPLWNRLKAAITAFLTVVWRQGALQGTTADEAFFVRCGLGETMIQADIDAGLVIMVIGVAPVKPAEFVVIRIGQKAGPAPS